MLLSEFNKLKWYLETEKIEGKRMKIIRDFLSKYRIGMRTKVGEDEYKRFEQYILYEKYRARPENNVEEMLMEILKSPPPKNISKIQNTKKRSTYNVIYSSLFSEYDSPLLKGKYKFNKEKSKEKKVKKSENLKEKKSNFDLFSTNSKLRSLSYQNKQLEPSKNYPANYNLIVDEIGKEIKEIKLDFEQKLNELENQNSSERKKMPKLNSKAKKTSRRTQEIAKRLYYKIVRKQFGIEEINKKMKLTEFICFNSAKNKLLFDKEGKELGVSLG